MGERKNRHFASEEALMGWVDALEWRARRRQVNTRPPTPAHSLAKPRLILSLRRVRVNRTAITWKRKAVELGFYSVVDDVLTMYEKAAGERQASSSGRGRIIPPTCTD
jgi:hypothetical protein